MSALREALTDYLATCRALGTKHRYPATALRRFVEFVEREGEEFVTVGIALRWAVASVGTKDATRARRLGIVRGFASWLRASDPRTEIPPQRILPTGQRRPVPYIYKDQEITDLMRAARGLRSATGLRCWTYETLVGLLAATGLRPGEALALDVPDVDLTGGILAVRESKFGKSRLIPVEATSRVALADYAWRRDEACPDRSSAAFLVSERGTRIGSCAARRTFAKLSQITGLRPSTTSRRIGHGPRLQDIRHTFATRRLIEWYRSGHDVDRRMPSLCTYLGHVRVEDTYWYLQAVPELLQLATERMEADRGEKR
jgi:integrase